MPVVIGDLSRFAHSRSLHTDRLRAMYKKATLTFDLWLGRDMLLDLYVKGVIVNILREERSINPNQFSFIPSYVQFFDRPRDLVEWAILRRLVQSWLNHLAFLSLK